MADDHLDAVARAQAIAARLRGVGGATVSTNPDPPTDANAVADAALAALGQSTNSKRKRWGDDPSSNSGGGVSSLDDALAQAMSAKRVNTGQTTQKLMIPVEKYPGYNFIGLLIGPGGSKQRELVNEAGGNVRISIRGKGSSSSNANPRGDEDPLHVLLEGNAENVQRAADLIEPLLNDPVKAQEEKDKQLKGLNSSSGYQPKPVAEILGLNGAGGHYGPGEGAEVIEEKIGIPNGFVGYIIGKGGESITSMQRKSGCRVQIQKESEMEPGTTQRIITLTGATPESVSMCRGIIEEMVQERARLNDSRGGGQASGANAAGQAAQLQRALSEGQAHVTVAVPNGDVGLIIGKGGMTIRSIQERSGANVQIPQGPDHDNPAIRTVNITHPNKEGAEFAKTLIEETLATKLNHGGGVSYGAAAGAAGSTSVTVQIPDADVGMCIGKSGCVIREMQQRTQTRIQIPSQPTPGQIYRLATVTGPPEGCAKVQEIIARISAEQSSQFVMTGEVFNTYGQQAYGQQAYGQQAYGGAQQAGGQADYSAQWAAYYAAQGQSTGAAATGATGGAATTSQAATSTDAAATGGADQYYEDFFRYASHYGEEAARKTYGAWAPPEGTPNPYGVNPNLAAAPTSAPAPAAPTAADVKDSSARRGVSNLPAWMTQK
jgi:far upstream element-binding protein